MQGHGARVADDPAIWIHPSDPSRSLLFLSDKERGIYVFDLQGRQIQHVDFGSRINNIDVRCDFRWKNEHIDVLAANLRDAGKLALLRIRPEAPPWAMLSILADQHETSNRISPDSYGFALYRRTVDGALFVFDKPKGPQPIRQWRVSGEDGTVRTTRVRVIDDVPMGIAEGFVADDTLGFVYFTEEARGIHKYHADPEHPVGHRIGFFADRDGAVPDLEGLALYARSDGTGSLVLSSQGSSTFLLFDRQGTNAYQATFRADGSHGTDGLDVTAASLPGFPLGFAVIHDDPGRRYLLYDWRDIQERVLSSSEP